MGDFMLRTNDMIQITLPPPAISPLLASPVALLGTGTTVMIGGQPVCLLGDELPPSLRGPIPYTAPPYATPGTGKLTIMLKPANMTKKTVQGKVILLKGDSFTATFTVVTPATMPTPSGPKPDDLLSKTAQCMFITTNMNTQAG